MSDQTPELVKPQRLIKKTYLKLIRNSVGTKMFRNFYLEQDSATFDATRGGELSCAYYVSGLLVIFQLIKSVHGTVTSTEKDLETSGWVKTDKPVPGDVIIWEPMDNDSDSNKHIGFYIGKNKAISNSSTKRKVIIHDWTYNNTRKIKSIYSKLVFAE